MFAISISFWDIVRGHWKVQRRESAPYTFQSFFYSLLRCICALGHLILDEDLERTTFIVGTGVIGPMDIVSVVISTTLELPTLENGAIRIVYPTLLTPIVTAQMTSSKSENGGKLEENGYLCLNLLWQHYFSKHCTFQIKKLDPIEKVCCSAPQTNQLFRRHLRKTRPGPGLRAAVRSRHLHRSSCQPGTLWTQLPAAGQRGLPTGWLALLPQNIFDSVVLDSAIVKNWNSG